MMYNQRNFTMKRDVGIVLLAAFVGLALLLSWTGYVAAAGATPIRTGVGAFELDARNPAGLGIGQPVFRLLLQPMTAEAYNDSWPWMTFDHWADKKIPLEERQKLVASIPDTGLGFGMDASQAFVLGIGGLSGSLTMRETAFVSFEKEFFELLFLGNELNRKYTMGVSGGTAVIGDAAIAHGRNINDKLRVGLRYHYLVGIAYGGASVKATAEAIHTDEDIKFDGDMVFEYVHTDTDASGVGMAFDIGATYRINDALTVGAAVLDWGRITWPSHIQGVCAFEVDSLSGSGDEGNEPDPCTETPGGEFKYTLPRKIELSAGWQLPWAFHLGTAYTITTADAADFTVKSRSELETMLVWQRWKFLQLGVGAVFAKDRGTSLNAGAGLRLGPLQVRSTVNNVQTLFGVGDAQSIGGGLDIGIVF